MTVRNSDTAFALSSEFWVHRKTKGLNTTQLWAQGNQKEYGDSKAKQQRSMRKIN